MGLKLNGNKKNSGNMPPQNNMPQNGYPQNGYPQNNYDPNGYNMGGAPAMNVNFGDTSSAGQTKKGKQPKVKKEKLKNVSNNSKRNTVILGLLAVIAVGLVLNFISSAQMRDTVQVAVLSSAVPQDGIIRTDNMYAVEMSVDEYERYGIVTLADGTKRKAVVLWSEINQINNTYASYYIREGTPIYWDAIGNETPKQYSYLYNMDGELLKISIDPGTFGQIIVPGDHINVRAAYTEQVYTLPTEEEYMLQMQVGISPQTSVRRQILLFNNVAILDMLNGAGESIFDKYYELLSLPKDEQLKMVQSEEFISAVQPSEILLNVTPEEADRYMSIQSSGPTYMMTLLPRTSSNAITEVLNELQVGFARGN